MIIFIKKYWALMKQRFRRILLAKMLESPDSRQTPLKDALQETFKHTPDEPVIKFVHMGLKMLREAANNGRREKNIEQLEAYLP